MTKKNLYKKVIKTKPETPAPATSPSDTSVSNQSSKKLSPKWGEPVIVSAPTKDSSKKLNPKWGKPVFVGAPILETPVPATPPSDVPVPNHNVEEIEQVTVGAPIFETPVPAPPSDAPGPNYNVVQPISVKEGSHRKMVVGVAISVVVLLCTLIGYWSYQTQKSEKTAEYAAPKEAAIAVPAVTDKNSAQVSSEQKETKSIPEEAVRNLVTKWLASWKSGDMGTYRSFYASDFQSKGMNLDAWISHKVDVNKKSKDINISIDDLQISANTNIAKAVFTQHYSSSILKDSGKKTLELRKINNEWKIYREIM